MASVKHNIYVLIMVVFIVLMKCDEDYDDVTVIPTTTEKPILVEYDAGAESGLLFLIFASIVLIIVLTVYIWLLLQNIVEKLKEGKEESIEENKKEGKEEEMKKVEKKVEKESKKPIGSIPNAHKEFIEKKKSAEKEWEPETKYRNRGTVFVRSQNVTAPDFGVGLDDADKKKKGGISKVKWSDDPIGFYEIGDDLDRFEELVYDAKGGGFSSSSDALTATIKKL